MKKQKPFVAQLAKQIHDLRLARGMSIRQLARRAKLPPESVSRSERGITEITLSGLDKLCRALLVDLPTFFQFAKQHATNKQHSVEIRRAVTLLLSLPNGKLRRVVKGLELFLEETPPPVSKREEN